MPQQTHLRRNAGGSVSVPQLAQFFAIGSFLALNLMIIFEDSETLQDAWQLRFSSEVKPHPPTSSNLRKSHHSDTNRGLLPANIETEDSEKAPEDHQDNVQLQSLKVKPPTASIPRKSHLPDKNRWLVPTNKETNANDKALADHKDPIPYQHEPTQHRILQGKTNNDLGMVHCPTDPLRASNFDIPRGSLVNVQPAKPYLGVLLDAGRHYFPITWIKRLFDRLQDLRYNLLHFRLTDDQAFNLRLMSSPELANRATPYLGVLLDAGRHYFPIIWIKRLLDRLQDLHYNLLHFRLTDDQAFNVRLTSHPELAYPSAVNNPGRLVYSVQELKDITAYAKERGIRIMPEINLPGHAGAWAGARPDMVVHCPKYLCNVGYGVPLNITHVDLPGILHDIMAEIIEIFDDPPFLHLGGDEVNLGLPCFRQLGIPMFDYAAFEQMLAATVKKVGYPLDQVVRWEQTGQEQIDRAGRIVHYWMTHPVVRRPFFISTGLYFDTNEDATAFDVYEMTRTILAARPMPTAIIAGTFELSTEFWYDRNVLGKLIAVAMGASLFSTNKNEKYSLDNSTRQLEVLKDWKNNCNHVGFGPTLCDTSGKGTMTYKSYRRKLKSMWKIWKNDTCIRFTYSTDGRSVRDNPLDRTLSYTLGLKNWSSFPIEVNVPAVEKSSRSIPFGWDSVLGQHSVRNVGVILDVTSSMIIPDRLMDIVTNYVARLGFNLIQLPLVTKNGFVYKSRVQQRRVVHSLLASKENPSYDLEEHIKPLVLTAADLGIAVMPEISVSTDAAGWFKTGYVMNCAHYFCDRGTLVADITKVTFLPVMYSVIAELRRTFTSPYFHLGSDERQDGMACIVEDGGGDFNSFSSYESDLTNMLEMAGISVENFLRWSNSEQTHYPDRTGKITHHRANTHPAQIEPRNRTSSPFFASVDIMEGDAWSVYQRTRELASLHPEGILAEIRTLTKQQWATLGIAQRLIAFALGVSSSSPTATSSSFQSQYMALCQALGWSVSGDDEKEGCMPLAAFESTVIYFTETPGFIQQHCNVLTKPAKVYVKKPVKPFYETSVNAKGQLTH